MARPISTKQGAPSLLPLQRALAATPLAAAARGPLLLPRRRLLPARVVLAGGPQVRVVDAHRLRLALKVGVGGLGGVGAVGVLGVQQFVGQVGARLAQEFLRVGRGGRAGGLMLGWR